MQAISELVGTQKKLIVFVAGFKFVFNRGNFGAHIQTARACP